MIVLENQFLVFLVWSFYTGFTVCVHLLLSYNWLSHSIIIHVLGHEKTNTVAVCHKTTQINRDPHEESLGPELPAEHTAETDQTGGCPG